MTRQAGQKRGYILAILTLVYVVNFIDRQILPILLQSIKQEFGVSDAALGLLVGPAFAFFYAIMGIPIAMLADRMNRRTLIGWSLMLFSGMTMLCGAAVQFWQLALARIGTGTRYRQAERASHRERPPPPRDVRDLPSQSVRNRQRKSLHFWEVQPLQILKRRYPEKGR